MIAPAGRALTFAREIRRGRLGSQAVRGQPPYYARGRLPYPPEVADALSVELALDGTGRLLDVGCGPGSLALLLAPLFRDVVGLDPDPG